jgi:DNA modification methylase
VFVSFGEWTKGRPIQTLGTNAGAVGLPFQDWRRFKEAFAPELVSRAVGESDRSVNECIDPFGGSGTTGLACQFLGIRPTLVEVNPFLADLIEAKLVAYNTERLARDLGSIVRNAAAPVDARDFFRRAPATFLEPGIGGRWIFDTEIGERIAAYSRAIAKLREPAHRRLFRVLLGGVLIELSNVTVSGKGRRYRRGWEAKRGDPSAVERLFCSSATSAIEEVHRYGRRLEPEYTLLRGDARKVVSGPSRFDLAVFSPPYPNSFDYTDVYNVELWALGYLGTTAENQRLRKSTLCSHVQVDREFPKHPPGSPLLDLAIGGLLGRVADLWDRRIPLMVAGYFADLMSVLGALHSAMRVGGSAWIVIGDSRYAGVSVRAADILVELSLQSGWRLRFTEPCRSMRLSPQQGGSHELAETLVVLQKA